MSNLVVQTNVLALNSHRNLKTVGGKLATASARLSSGYKINSAADDASGLAISEKMRAQIRGLDMASKNTQDGISLVQTAEGGLQEIDNMLQRIRELTVQASNDTNDYQSADRKKLQEEIDQLTAGIDAMAGQVEFNKKKLLDGSLTDASTKGSLLADINVKMQNMLGTSVGSGSAVSALATMLDTTSGGGLNAELSEANRRSFSASVAYTANVTSGGVSSTYGVTINAPSVTTGAASDTSTSAVPGTMNTTTTGADVSTWTMTATLNRTDSAPGATTGTSFIFVGSSPVTSDVTNQFTHTDMTVTLNGIATTATQTTFQATTDNMPDATYRTDTVGLTVVATSNVSDVKALTEYVGQIDAYIGNLQDAKKNGATGVDDIMANLSYNRQAALDIYAGLELASAQSKSYEALDALSGNSLWFQTGANSEQGINVGIGKVTSDILGIGKGYGISTIKVDRPNAYEISAQVDIVDNALQYVTSQRAKLGAVQNRMEYTKSSLEVSSENLSAAESRIRDTDMAKEMMKLTSANVLQQAGVSMLSQANQAPQSVLSLLR